MALNVYYSCNFRALTDALVERAEAGRRGVAGWRRPITVVVPSLDMGSYLELAVARSRGVAVNYRFATLQGFLTEQIEQAAGDAFKVLGREVLKTVLLDCFGDADFFAAGDFGDIARYIGADISSQERTADVRRYQLARRLATIYEEYIFSRADMLEAWSAGEDGLNDPSKPVREIERWQAELWRHITGADGRVDFDGQDYLPLPQAFEKVRGRLVDNLREQDIDQLHLFGFAGFGSQFLQMLEALAAGEGNGFDVHVYFNAPTRDGRADEHPALADWGRVGRDTFSQLADASDAANMVPGTMSSAPANTVPGTMLGALQGQIEEGRAPANAVELDESIRLLEAPGIRREVEIVANEIWRLLGGDDELRFSDIAVAVPDGEKERYLPHIEAVFGEFHRLPYTLNSLSLDSQSPVVEAVEQLIRLPFGKYRRGELLNLAVHPNIIGHFREADESAWVEWTDGLNVLYGADRAHQSERGSYLSGDMFNWDQGLRRLALGSFLAVPDARDEAQFEVGGHRYLPEQVELGDVDVASSFNTAISSLVNDARWLAGKKATLAEWAEILSALADEYICPSTHEDADFEADARDKARVIETLESLASLPDIGEVSYRTASLYALDLLSALESGAHHRFVGGVVVSSPARLRALPFEHVIVMGMGEGIFPSLDPHSELDLRLAEPLEGDIEPSQRDKYHFLELLTAARSSLTLSWIGRESTTGESVPPSSIISDLRRMLGVRRPDDEAESDALTTVFPLRRYDRHGDQFDALGLPTDQRPGNAGVSTQLGANYHPEAFREAQLDAVRERIERVGGLATKKWTGQAFRDANRRLYRAQDAFAPGERAENILRIIRPPKTDEPTEPRALPSRLRYSKLYQFLKTPLQTKAKAFAGIYDDADDAFVVEHEQFGYDNLPQVMLTRDVFAKVLTEGDQDPDLVGELNEVAAQNYAPGELPVDVFQECANREFSGKLDNVWTNLNEFFSDGCGFALSEDVRVYEFAPQADGDVLESPAVALQPKGSPEPIRVALTGTTVSYFPESHILLQVKKSASVGSKDFLKGFIDHLMMSASSSVPDEIARTAVVVPSYAWKNGPNSYDKFTLELPAISREQATEQLQRLTTALLVEPEFTLLPIEVVEKLLEEANDLETPEQAQYRAWQIAREEDSDRDYGGISSQYGPIANYLDYPPPDDPLKVIAERFRYHPTFDPELKGDA